MSMSILLTIRVFALWFAPFSAVEVEMTDRDRDKDMSNKKKAKAWRSWTKLVKVSKKIKIWIIAMNKSEILQVRDFISIL
jgi:hypothetical protein